MTLPPESSFFTPGRRIPYDNSYIYIDHCFVQHLPANPSAVSASKPPLLFIHGGGQTSILYLTTPDTRLSWAHLASSLGHPTYLLDAPDHGRSSYAPPAIRTEQGHGEPEWRTARQLWGRFRFGPDTEEAFEKLIPFEGSQFEALGAYEKRREWFEGLARSQMVRRWDMDEEEARGIRDAVRMLGGRVWVVAHSHGAAMAMKALGMDEEVGEDGDGFRMRNVVERMVLVEPGATSVSRPWLVELDATACVVVWGDYLEGHAVWHAIVKAYTDKGQVDNLMLPRRGIKGNSHFPMSDKNSDVVWKAIYDWLVTSKGW
ncbi:MAG: hypothetical protein M1820_007161 [Bogoriella megaspora]|nr:MAG: hypothetical protein M1820_007161 [Bogoriella megaspora]